MIQARDAALHVGVTGRGPDVVVLTGGPGCVQYLERDEISPLNHRAWYPEPRGVGRSGGGPHTMQEAIADLECIRAAAGVDTWIVVGHSWGCELGVRYVLEGSVRKSGTRIRIGGQLIDSDDGAHLWADRFDGALEDVFELQDKVTEAVVGIIVPRIDQAEVRR